MASAKTNFLVAAVVLMALSATAGATDTPRRLLATGSGTPLSGKPPSPPAYGSTESPGLPTAAPSASSSLYSLPEVPAATSVPAPLTPSNQSPSVVNDADCGVYLFTSYLDQSGISAPDGNYKETCKDISYNCRSDTITATCGNDLPDADEAHAYNVSSLKLASGCEWSIQNVWGVLRCVSDVDGPPSSSSSACEALGFTADYNSRLDSSGADAPDGTYKETCKNIGYDCVTDTLYAQCSKQSEGSTEQYTLSSLSNASDCEGNLANLSGILQCQLSLV